MTAWPRKGPLSPDEPNEANTVAIQCEICDWQSVAVPASGRALLGQIKDEHIRQHVDSALKGFETLATCTACAGAQDAHRPCFAVDCACPCSRVPTPSGEETSR